MYIKHLFDYFALELPSEEQKKSMHNLWTQYIYRDIVKTSTTNNLSVLSLHPLTSLMSNDISFITSSTFQYVWRNQFYNIVTIDTNLNVDHVMVFILLNRNKSIDNVFFENFYFWYNKNAEFLRNLNKLKIHRHVTGVCRPYKVCVVNEYLKNFFEQLNFEPGKCEIMIEDDQYRYMAIFLPYFKTP